MPKKLILIALTFVLISFYLLVVTDMYLLPSISREDTMTNLQLLDSGNGTGAIRNDLVITKSGEQFSVSTDSGIVFRQPVPITIHTSPILHKPLGVDFAQEGAIQHIDTLYLSRSYSVYFVLFILSIVSVVYLLQWSKGKNIKEIYLYTFIILFALLLFFQYFR